MKINRSRFGVRVILIAVAVCILLFVFLALGSLSCSGRSERQASEDMDRLSFAHAESLATVAAYEDYLTEHPRGLHSREARSVIGTLSLAAAQAANTLPAYERFLGKFANENPDLSNKARDNIRRLLDQRHPLLRSARRANIIFDIKGPPGFAPGEYQYLWILEALCSYAGLQVTSAADSADVMIILSMSVKGAGTYYEEEGTGHIKYCYTGGSVRGTFRVQGAAFDQSEAFRTEYGTADAVSPCESAVENAEALFDREILVFRRLALNVWSEWFGRHVLGAALLEGNPYLPEIAAALIASDKGDTVTRQLIMALDNEDYLVRSEVMQSLERVTGERFGEDRESWKKWWAQTQACHSSSGRGTSD